MSKYSFSLTRISYDDIIILTLENIMKTYIHVNQHIIKANLKNGEDNAVITIKQGKKNTYCHEVAILGPSKVIYGGSDKPLLSCGARVVVETESEIEILR
jgi:hypothetical protein